MECPAHLHPRPRRRTGSLSGNGPAFPRTSTAGHAAGSSRRPGRARREDGRTRRRNALARTLLEHHTKPGGRRSRHRLDLAGHAASLRGWGIRRNLRRDYHNPDALGGTRPAPAIPRGGSGIGSPVRLKARWGPCFYAAFRISTPERPAPDPTPPQALVQMHHPPVVALAKPNSA